MKVKIEFRELSNSVVAAVEIEDDSTINTTDSSLNTAKSLFMAAQQFAAAQSMKKLK